MCSGRILSARFLLTLNLNNAILILPNEVNIVKITCAFVCQKRGLLLMH